MKKLLVIPIMVLYILAVSGVMVHAHYCGDTLESWNMYLKGEGCEDGDCGDEEDKSDSCCEDKVIASKVSHDQHHVDALKLKIQAPLFEAISQDYFTITIINANSSSPGIVANHANAPPGLWENIPLYKLHSSFTYYG